MKKRLVILAVLALFVIACSPRAMPDSSETPTITAPEAETTPPAQQETLEVSEADLGVDEIDTDLGFEELDEIDSQLEILEQIDFS